MSLADLIRRPVGAMAGYNPGPAPEELAAKLGLPAMVELGTNENPFGPSPRALLAIQAELGRANRYPDPLCQPLREALARRHGLVPDNVVVANGADNLLTLLALAFLEPGQEVVMADLTFPMYRKMVALAGAVPREVPLYQLTHDLAALAAAVTPRTRLLLVCNPNNPTGTMVEPGALLDFAQALPPQVILVLDEAYVDFAAPEKRTDLLPLVAAGRPVLCLESFSKLHGLAGLRVGYALGPFELIAALGKVREPFAVNRLAQAAALAALDDEEFRARVVAETTRQKALLYREFAALGLACRESEANFVFVDLGARAEAVVAGLARRGVLVRGLGPWGAPTCARITVGTPEQNRQLLAALRAALAEGPTINANFLHHKQ